VVMRESNEAKDGCARYVIGMLNECCGHSLFEPRIGGCIYTLRRL